MRILAIADEKDPSIYDYYRPGKLDEYDLILSAGDLSANYLEFLVTMAHCPLVYVHGNHDDRLLSNPPEGCVCADGDLVEVGGLRILGLGGSYRYRKDGVNMYTEDKMRRRIHKLRWKIRRKGGVDIVLTHAPIRGVNDFDNLSHRGFECFRDLIQEFRPSCLVHGHIHRTYGVNIPRTAKVGDTTVINAFEKYAFDIDVPERPPRTGKKFPWTPCSKTP